jgi:hypothetical protein
MGINAAVGSRWVSATSCACPAPGGRISDIRRVTEVNQVIQALQGRQEVQIVGVSWRVFPRVRFLFGRHPQFAATSLNNAPTPEVGHAVCRFAACIRPGYVLWLVCFCIYIRGFKRRLERECADGAIEFEFINWRSDKAQGVDAEGQSGMAFTRDGGRGRWGGFWFWLGGRGRAKASSRYGAANRSFNIAASSGANDAGSDRSNNTAVNTAFTAASFNSSFNTFPCTLSSTGVINVDTESSIFRLRRTALYCEEKPTK